MPAAIVVILLYMTSVQIVPLAEVRALFAGGLLGYIVYEMIHYYIHHGSPPSGSYLARLKSHHVAHHYINPNRGRCCMQTSTWNTCEKESVYFLTYLLAWLTVVSAPDPHVTPARKRDWYLTSAFLVVLSQHVIANYVIRPNNHVIEY